MEGCERLGRKPAANRIAEATARRVALEAATIAEYEAKDRETKMRMQVHEQMRSFATAFRVEANKEKAKEAEWSEEEQIEHARLHLQVASAEATKMCPRFFRQADWPARWMNCGSFRGLQPVKTSGIL